MADLKISAMTAATQMALADVVPIVQGGANKKCAKQQLFEAAPSESLLMKWASGGNCGIADNSGGLRVGINTAGKVLVVNPGNSVNVQYDVGVSGNWAGSPPSDLKGAIDRMAALLVTLSGAPIP